MSDTAFIRDNSGLCFDTRATIEAAGPDTEKYLQGQLSQDVSSLQVGESTTTLLLSPQGKLVALLGLTRLETDRYIIDCHKEWVEAVLARLQRFLLRTECVFTEIELTSITVVSGQTAPDVTGESVHKSSSAGHIASAVGVQPVFSRRVDWPNLNVEHIFFDHTANAEIAAEAFVSKLGTSFSVFDYEVLDSLRIEAGVAEMGYELDETTIAAHANIVSDNVSFTKGCYVGQELIERIDAKDKEQPKRLVGLRPVDADGDTEVKLVAGIALQHNKRPAVTVTSVGYSSVLGTVIGMGYAKRNIVSGHSVTDPYSGAEFVICDLPLI